MFLSFTNEELNEIKNQLEKNVSISDRMYHLRRYRQCFIGSDAVSAIHEILIKNYQQKKKQTSENNNNTISREDAVTVGELLRKRGDLEHVVDNHQFKDSYLFFRFKNNNSNNNQNEKEEEKEEEEEEEIIDKTESDHNNKDNNEETEENESVPEVLKDVTLMLNNNNSNNITNTRESISSQEFSTEELNQIFDSIVEHRNPKMLRDHYNATMVQNTHPHDWKNPEPQSIYNMVVIGAGAGGLVSAIGSASVGGKVAIVEQNLFGGDCLVTGCVPSKALLRAAKACHEVKNVEQEFGIQVNADFSNQFPKTMERLRRLRAKISQNDSAGHLKSLGIDVFIGKAKFIDDNHISVNDEQILKFKRCSIATGSSPLIPNIPGLKDINYLTNETIFNLSHCPPKLGIIGTGAIGLEMAQAFNRFGSKVYLFGRSYQVLKRGDTDAAATIQHVLSREGIELVLDIEYDSIQRNSETQEKEITVKFNHNNNSNNMDPHFKTYSVNELLIATGRRPTVHGMDLEKAHVEYDESRGIHVNDFLQTESNNSVYAVGDCCLPNDARFTHAADAAARLLVRNALFFGRGRFKDLRIPSAIYTDPEVAHIGLTEVQAQQEGFKISVFRKSLADIDRAVIDLDHHHSLNQNSLDNSNNSNNDNNDNNNNSNDDNITNENNNENNESMITGFVKIITYQDSDQILGATIVAPHAGDLICIVGAVLSAGGGVKALGQTVFPYPSIGEALHYIADDYNRTRLTPVVKKSFNNFLKIRRY